MYHRLSGCVSADALCSSAKFTIKSRDRRLFANRCGAAHFAILFLFIAASIACPSLFAQTGASFTGAQSVVPIGSGISPAGAAIDTSGNLYIVDAANQQVVKAGWSNGTFTTTVVANAPNNGLNSPQGVAVDASGNVYISDTGNNRILKETLSSGSYTQTVILGTGVLTPSSPQGIEVDSSGNVFFANTGGDELVKLTASSNYAPSVVVSGLLGPRGVAIDSAGDLYIADVNSGATNSQVLKETLKSGSYTQSTIANHATNGLSDPVGVAVDPEGNVYVSDTGLDEVLKETLSGSTYSQSVLANKAANGITTPSGIAVDWSGSVYIADSGNADLLKVQSPAASFGMVPDASTSWTDQINFTFSASETLNSPLPDEVVAMGAVGQEFVDTQTGTCTAGQSYTAGQTCTVIVTFSPVYSGTRNGAVILQDSNANTIATALLSGVGTGPQMIHFGGFEQITATHIGQVSDVAVDSAGEVYLVDEGAAYLNSTPQPYKLDPASNIKLPLGGTSWELPIGIALDGAGNVYVSDYDAAAVYEINPTTNTRAQVPITLKGPIGVAVDFAGNLFVADAAGAAVYKMTPSGTITSLGSGWVQPNRLAVDSAGNLYVSDYGSGVISEISVAGVKSTITASIGSPFGVAVDPSGILYVASGAGTLDQTVYELTPAGKISTLVTQTDGAYPQGITLDTHGNLYIADSNQAEDLPSSLIYELDRADPLPAPLNFPTATDVQTKDTTDGNQTVTFQNIGNQTLEYATGAGSNPVYPASFPENAGDLSLCTSATPLAPGATCDVSMYFEPQAAGAISAAVAITDNSLNQADTTQSVALTGTGIGKTQTISFTPPASPVNYGVGPIALQATATSGLSITFSIVSGPGSVTGNQLTLTGVGTIVIAANQSGGGLYDPAQQQTQSVTVNQGAQTINFTPIASPVNYGVAPIGLSATATSGLGVTFSIVSGPGSVTGSTLTVTGVGTIVVAANQSGNADYTAAAQVTQPVVVNIGTQTINFSPLSSPVNYGVAPIGLSATATSGLGITFSLVSGPGSVTGSTLTITGVGSVEVAANQAGNADYSAAPEATQTITVNKGAQTIAFTAPPATVDHGVKPITLSAKSSSGLAVAFSVVSGPAKVSGDTLTITGVGAVVVGANQSGNADYLAAAEVTRDIAVKKGAQTITFTAPKTPVTYGVKPIALSAKSNSGLAIAFTVVSGPAKVKGDTLTITGAGTVVVAATQAGNSDWNAATEVKREIVVDKAKLTVTATSFTIAAGADVPTLTYKMAGFVNEDTQKTATTGVPRLATTATSPAKAGTYTIAISAGTLESKSYTFTFVDGKLTVNP